MPASTMTNAPPSARGFMSTTSVISTPHGPTIHRPGSNSSVRPVSRTTGTTARGVVLRGTRLPDRTCTAMPSPPPRSRCSRRTPSRHQFAGKAGQDRRTSRQRRRGRDLRPDVHVQPDELQVRRARQRPESLRAPRRGTRRTWSFSILSKCADGSRRRRRD